MPGNLFINLKLENNIVGFKSATLKQWVLSEYSVGLEFDFLNFLLNYLESFNKKDNSYHFKYQLAYFEMTPKLQNNKQYTNGVSDGYLYRNLKTNYKQVKLLDQLIIVTTYRQMYFLYIIWISKQKCFIFDPQIKPQTRIFDHEIVAKQLAEQFGFYFQPECVLLKEAKQDTKTIYRIGMIMEFLFKYIDSSNDVQKIEQIKVGVSSSHKLLDSIVWFVYKCYEQDIYLTEPNQQLEKYSDKIINYQEWQQEQQQQQYNYETERVNRQQNQLQQGRNDISTNFVWDENQKSQSFFKKIANSALQSETQTSYLVDNNPKLRQSKAILLNAQGFIDQKEYEQLPRHKNYEMDKSKESSRMSLSKTQFQEMMDDMRQQIKSDVMREMMFQQEQWLEDQEMKLRSKKDELNEAIAEEYMQQVRFQRYKEYMEYLLQYYYDNDPQEYDNLLAAYHQKLKEIALNGLVQIQKQEFLKLQKLTKEKQVQQNQQIDIALFNQKKEYAKIYPQKEKLKNEILNSQLPLQFPEKKKPYQFQFTSIMEENPFEFNEKKKILDLEPKNIQDYMVDQSDSKIQEMLKQWEFKSESSYKSDNPDDEIDRFRKKYQNYQDDLKSKNNGKSLNDLSQSLAKSQSQINFQSQSAIQSLQNSVAISKVNSQRWLQQQEVQSNKSRNQQF
ncbi:hypothetical protein pb186bvf_000625 [Paramecium bursaria]